MVASNENQFSCKDINTKGIPMKHFENLFLMYTFFSKHLSNVYLLYFFFRFIKGAIQKFSFVSSQLRLLALYQAHESCTLSQKKNKNWERTVTI